MTISRNKQDGGVKELYDQILKATELGSTVKNDFGKTWLGTLVERLLGVDPRDPDKYICRGTLCSFGLNEEGSEICLETDTAWEPMLKMWIDIVDKYSPGAEILYTAEEPGNGIYYTNDPEYENKFCINSWVDDIESDFCASEDTIRKLARKLTGKKCDRRTGIEKVVDMIHNASDDVYINPWDFDTDLSWAV